LRLGCLLAHRELAGYFRRAQPPFPVNALALIAAEAAVRNRAGVRRFVREVIAARNEMQTALTRMGIRWWPSAGNYLLADLGPRAPRILRALERHGILLRDRSRDFGRPGPVRITIGTRAQMRRVTRALAQLLPRP
jgi:histidinol-phosphate aminotransferase